jgi:hypothetical protein
MLLSYLRCLYLFVHRDVQRLLCCVFWFVCLCLRLTLHEHLSSLPFFVEFRVAYLFCVVLLCILAFLVSCCDVHSDFRIKRCSVRPYLLLFVGGLMSHLRYLCLCLCILMSKAYCVVFVFFVLCLAYPILPVSLNCSFLITPSVFSNVYLSCVLCTQCCQFLWNVHS